MRTFPHTHLNVAAQTLKCFCTKDAGIRTNPYPHRKDRISAHKTVIAALATQRSFPCCVKQMAHYISSSRCTTQISYLHGLLNVSAQCFNSFRTSFNGIRTRLSRWLVGRVCLVMPQKGPVIPVPFGTPFT